MEATARKVVTYLSIAALIAGLPLQGKAETREECEANLRPNTRSTTGSEVGGFVVGTVVGTPTCTMLLAGAPVDLGVSWAICTAAFALMGHLAGAALAESANVEAARRCATLIEK
jgi:hypothetical protein